MKTIVAIAASALLAFAGACDSTGKSSENMDTTLAERPAVSTDSVSSEATDGGHRYNCSDADAGAVEAGRVLFEDKGNCTNCHGEDGSGSSLGPNLRDAQWINVRRDYNQIAEVVRWGVPDPIEHPAPMPPMGGGQLDDDEICALAAYVLSLSQANE